MGIRIARFSELYLFIFQQIQLVMVLLGVGIVRQRKLLGRKLWAQKS